MAAYLLRWMITNCLASHGPVFFTSVGHAFHGTYWHDNFGTPMSRGCVNMRTEEATRSFRWTRPLHEPDRIYTPRYGTLVVITP